MLGTCETSQQNSDELSMLMSQLGSRPSGRVLIVGGKV